MNKDMTPQKLSELVRSLTGKECAFLALEYFNKEYKENKKYRNELEIINDSISPYSSDPKRQEFVFYYKIGCNLENFCLDLQTNMLLLKNLNEQIGQIRSLLTNSIAISSILSGFRFIPKIVTEEEFERIYQEVKSEFLSETLSLKAVAAHEAFLRLREEGFLTQTDDFYSCNQYFEERRNKSKDQIAGEKAQEIFKHLQQNEEKRQRGVEIGEGAYVDYKGLTLDEIKQLIVEKGNLNVPTEEEVKKWDEAKEKELIKLQEAINLGKLKAAKVDERGGWYHSGKEYLGEDGILGESWYNYSDKLDKNFNEFIDNKIDAVEFYRGDFVIAKSGFTSYIGDGNKNCAAERSRQSVEENLKLFLLLDEKDGLLDITNPQLKEALIFRVNETQFTMQRLVDHIEMVKRIEEIVLEGVVKISDDLKEKGREAISEAITEQENFLNSILKYYQLSAYFKPVALKDLEKYKLVEEINPDEEWINKSINKLINLSNKEANYSYQYKN